MDREPALNNPEAEQLLSLAEELDEIQSKKFRGGDVVMQKLIRCLREGDAHAAKVFLGNEADKFNEYRGDAIPLIIEKLYGGSGSPWPSIKRKLKMAAAQQGTESPKTA